MKYFNIDCDMDTDLVERFVKFVNETEGRIAIYLNSPGGFIVSAQIISDIIDSDVDRFEITAGDFIASAAFWLFFNCGCAKEVFDGTIGMYHLSGKEVRIKTNGGVTGTVEQEMIKHLKSNGLALNMAFCESVGMNPQEIKAIKSGKDVVFSTERLWELLKNGI